MNLNKFNLSANIKNIKMEKEEDYDSNNNSQAIKSTEIIDKISCNTEEITNSNSNNKISLNTSTSDIDSSTKKNLSKTVRSEFDTIDSMIKKNVGSELEKKLMSDRALKNYGIRSNNSNSKETTVSKINVSNGINKNSMELETMENNFVHENLQFFKISYKINYLRNRNISLVLKIDCPVNYVKESFIFSETIETINGRKIHIAIAYVFIKGYYNGQMKIYFQLDGENFKEKALNYFAKLVKNLLFDENSNKLEKSKKSNSKLELDKIEEEGNETEELTSSTNEQNEDCDFEKDCQPQGSKKEINVNINEENDSYNINNDTFVRVFTHSRMKMQEFKNLYINNDVFINFTDELIKEENNISENIYNLEGNFNLSWNYTNSSFKDRDGETRKVTNYAKLYELGQQIYFKQDVLDACNKSLLDYLKNECYSILLSMQDAEEQLSKIEQIKHFRSTNMVLSIDFTISHNLNGSLYKSDKIGLINEAMTCYMNSMLQILNSINYFKKEIFSVEENDKYSCVYGLQRLFYELHSSKNPVSTLFLIKSFGWNQSQLIEQHDIQEFNLKLSDSLEKKLKGTKSEGLFKNLFQISIENFIKCKNIEYQSVREEKMSDIGLDVKGFKDIYESLNNYIKEELLEGENQYDAEGHGKQDASKGVIFKKLPPVLIFQLKRFEYNFLTNNMEKVNDEFKFYETLDMSGYVKESNRCQEEDLYELHSVVDHSGNLNNGHYFCYIKNYDANNNLNWEKFNDEIVNKCTSSEAIDENYGGERIGWRFNQSNSEIDSYWSKNSEVSAYILVYIRKSQIKKIICPFNYIESSSQRLRDMINQDIEIEENTKIEKAITKSNIPIYLFDKNLISNHDELGILSGYSDNNKNDPLTETIFCLTFPKQMCFKHLVDFISQQSGIDSKRILLFKYEYLIVKDTRAKNFFKLTCIKNYQENFEDHINSIKGKKHLIFLIADKLNLDSFFFKFSDSEKGFINHYPARFKLNYQIDETNNTKNNDYNTENIIKKKLRSFNKENNIINKVNNYYVKINRHNTMEKYGFKNFNLNIEAPVLEDINIGDYKIIFIKVLERSNELNHEKINHKYKNLKHYCFDLSNSDSIISIIENIKTDIKHYFIKYLDFSFNEICEDKKNKIRIFLNKYDFLDLIFIKENCNYFAGKIGDSSLSDEMIVLNDIKSITDLFTFKEENLYQDYQILLPIISFNNSIEINDENDLNLKIEIEKTINELDLINKYISDLKSLNIKYSSDCYVQVSSKVNVEFKTLETIHPITREIIKKYKFKRFWTENEVKLQIIKILKKIENPLPFISSTYSKYGIYNYVLVTDSSNSNLNEVVSLEDFIKNKLNEESTNNIRLFSDNNKSNRDVNILTDFLYDKNNLLFKFKIYDNEISKNINTVDIVFFDYYGKSLFSIQFTMSRGISLIFYIQKLKKFLISKFDSFKIPQDLLIDYSSDDPELDSQMKFKFICKYFKLITQFWERNLPVNITEISDVYIENLKSENNKGYKFFLRFQPFSFKDLKAINEYNNLNLYVVVGVSKDNKTMFDPLIMTVNKDTKYNSMKELIIKSIPSYSCTLNQEIDKILLSNIKYYSIKSNGCSFDKLKNLFINTIADDVLFNNQINSNFILAEFPAISNDFKEEGSMSIN